MSNKEQGTRNKEMARLHSLFLVRCFLFFSFLNSFSFRPKEDFYFFLLYIADGSFALLLFPGVSFLRHFTPGY